MNVCRIKDAYEKDLELLLQSLDISDDNLDHFIQLMIDEGFINEGSHPWAFVPEDEEEIE